MKRYERSSIVLGYVEAKQLIPAGNMAIIRTLFGDNTVEINDNTILIIDYSGNVFPISKEKFNSNYTVTRKKFRPEFDYVPTIKNADTGKVMQLLPLAKSCTSTGELNIFAKKISKTTKLFPYWDCEKYMLGQKGDYIAVSIENKHNVFIIEKNLFKKTYKPMKNS